MSKKFKTYCLECGEPLLIDFDGLCRMCKNERIKDREKEHKIKYARKL